MSLFLREKIVIIIIIILIIIITITIIIIITFLYNNDNLGKYVSKCSYQAVPWKFFFFNYSKLTCTAFELSFSLN